MEENKTVSPNSLATSNMPTLNEASVDFLKYSDGLVPAIVQDATTKVVLMLGFMNQAALAATQTTGKVTFFSRSKQRLWTKGETSGNYLLLRSIIMDCDNDTLLIQADPVGPVCHTGATTCFSTPENGEKSLPSGAIGFIPYLENIIAQRIQQPSESSYTAKLFARGINKMAQKVGEEAVELVIEAKDNDDALFLNEAADLLFHYLILLQAKGFRMASVLEILQNRHTK